MSGLIFLANATFYALCNTTGSSAIFAAIRRASSFVSNFAADLLPFNARPPNEAASHGVLRNRLPLDLDDEAGRGLLRLVALSIEGLPGGRLEERYSIVDAVPFDDADIGRRRCALDGDDTAAQREKRLAVLCQKRNSRSPVPQQAT